MQTISVLIVDDEEPARNLIKSYLASHGEIKILGECRDGYEGFRMIQELHPDLIFLDVQMPKLTGFELLEILENPPAVIFTTAFDEFAIKAFEMNAVDYLLKPFSQARFDAALQKASEKLAVKNRTESDSIARLVKTVSEKDALLERIVVRSNNRIHIIPVEQIVYFEAEDDYVMLYTRDKKYLKQLTMKYLEEHLDSKDFVRIHRSVIVRVEEVEKLEHYAHDNYLAIMKNGVRLRVSDTGYRRLKEVLKF
ncbi:MAG: LytR/AlgR family response regulator transcription factor [Bacteroidales bacterium]